MMTYYLHNNDTLREGSACPGEGVYCHPRPVVVLDPEDREQVERLYDLIDAAEDRTIDDGLDSEEWAKGAVQTALREFANPTPPRPEEPTTRGSVVKDAKGLEWVRVHPAGDAWVNGYGRWAAWDEIEAVSVVRP